MFLDGGFVDGYRCLGHQFNRVAGGFQRQFLPLQAADNIGNRLFQFFFQLVDGLRVHSIFSGLIMAVVSTKEAGVSIRPAFWRG
jgi:hypothetical protein